MVEHRTLNPLVEGSSPSAPSTPDAEIAYSSQESAIFRFGRCLKHLSEILERDATELEVAVLVDRVSRGPADHRVCITT